MLCGIYLAFIGLGLPNGLLGIVWPSMRQELGLPLEAGGVLSGVILCSSAAACLFLPRFLKQYRAATLALLGSALAAASLLGFRFAPSHLTLAMLCVPLGAGQGILDLSLNHHVAGRYSSRSVSWLHTCWCVGAGMGVLLAPRAMNWFGSWRDCYTLLGLIQLVITVAFLTAFLLWGRDDAPGGAEAVKPDFSILKDAAIWSCVLIVFLYSGAECSVSMWANSLLVEARQLSPATASACMSAFFAALLIGRFLSGVLVNRLGDRRMIAVGITVSGIASVFLCIGSIPAFSTVGIALFGLGLAPIMPCMVHLTAEHFGTERAADVQGLQFCISYLGGSILSAALGALYAHTTLEAFAPSMIVLLLGMIFLFRRITR